MIYLKLRVTVLISKGYMEGYVANAAHRYKNVNASNKNSIFIRKL